MPHLSFRETLARITHGWNMYGPHFNHDVNAGEFKIVDMAIQVWSLPVRSTACFPIAAYSHRSLLPAVSSITAETAKSLRRMNPSSALLDNGHGLMLTAGHDF